MEDEVSIRKYFEIKQHIMTRNFFFFLVTLSFLLLVCNRNDGSDTTINSEQNIQTLVHVGETREYILYVPNSYDGTSDIPLFFCFLLWENSQLNNSGSE